MSVLLTENKYQGKLDTKWKTKYQIQGELNLT